MQPDGVSVIICAYNAAGRIRPTLEVLQQQMFSSTGIGWEVILVDNASTDNTEETAKEIWNQNPLTRFSVVKEKKPGLMHARHRGLQVAGYEIVSFIDDDNWVEEKWVEKIYQIFSNDEKIGACGGRSIAVFEKEEPGWFSFFENSFAVGKQGESAGYVDDKKGFLWGAGLSFRKKLWTELQNREFTNLTIGRQGKNITAGEDTELCYAFRLLGYKLFYEPDLWLKHYMPAGRMQFSYLEKMCYGFGKSFARLNCYRVLLYPGFTVRHWFYEWMATWKKIFHLRVSSLFEKDIQVQHKLKADMAYWKGYAAQVWEDGSAIYKNIAALRKIFTINPHN